MNWRTCHVFCLFVATQLLVSCGSLSFVASGRTPFKISAGKNSEHAESIESSADFYFWGKFPENTVIDLEDISMKLGLEEPSYVVVEQSTSLKNFFLTIVTLGLYCPVNYKISLLTNKGPLQ
ncbi:MAG: hypothetical protein Q7U04_17330 [Bacteriovorax sp.]|nr:hypothetical protein [Bacteriovorax sp.]